MRPLSLSPFPASPAFLSPAPLQGKRGRMSEKAEDDILMKRAETEAAGKAVRTADAAPTIPPARLCDTFPSTSAWLSTNHQN